jgi:hypothetical protein
MPLFTVTHIISNQGYGEEEIVTRDVEANTAIEAIRKLALCEGWVERASNWDRGALLNPEAPNRSEDYCDYYMAELQP